VGHGPGDGDLSGYGAEFVKAVKGTGIEPHAPWERTVTAAKQLSKAAAR
jgi:hypothetical protein